MEKTWYLYWFMTFQTDSGLIQTQLESRQMQPTEQLCHTAMGNKQLELDRMIGNDLYIFNDLLDLWWEVPPDPDQKLGRVVGYTVGCEPREQPWGDEPIKTEGDFFE